MKGKFNVRKDTTPEPELISSVKAHGVLNPIHVRNNPKKPGHYWLVDGERRLNAAKAAKCGTVPIIPEGDMDEAEALVLSLATNEGQKSLSNAELAVAFKRLRKLKLSFSEIARVMGFEERKVRETLQALTGVKELQEAVKSDDPEEKIPPRAAARVATLPKNDQKKVVKKIKGKNANQGVAEVRKVEAKKKITRRGRKALKFPLVKDARQQLELLEMLLKWTLKNRKVSKKDEARIYAHAEVVELLKGKRTMTKLYPYVSEALQDMGKTQSKKKTTKKVTKKKVTKKKATKRKTKKTTRKKAAKKSKKAKKTKTK